MNHFIPYQIRILSVLWQLPACSGLKDTSKIRLTNAALKDWMKTILKVKKSEEGNYYAPSIQNMKICTFFLAGKLVREIFKVLMEIFMIM